MAAGISLGIASETKAFKDGIETGVIKPVEDATAKLDALGKTKGPAQLDSALEGSQKASKDLAGEIAKTADKIERSFADAGDSSAQSLGKVTTAAEDTTTGTGKLADSVQGVGDVADSALKGDFVGAIENAAASVSGLTGLIPGVGAAVGVVASEALPLLLSGFQESQKAAAELKQNIEDAYEKAAEDGRAYLDQAQIIAAANKVIFDDTARVQAQKDALALGLDVQTVILANAGDQNALNVVIDQTNTLQEAYNQKVKDSIGTISTRGILASGEAQTLGDINARYTDISGAQQQAAQNAQLSLDIQNKQAGVLQQQVDTVNTLPSIFPVKIAVDTSALDAALNDQKSIAVTVYAYTPSGKPIY